MHLIARTKGNRDKEFIAFTAADVAKHPDASVASLVSRALKRSTINSSSQIMYGNQPAQPVLPPETHRWVVKDQDISLKFDQFRKRCVEFHFRNPRSPKALRLSSLADRFVCARAFAMDAFNSAHLIRIKNILANYIDNVINEDKAIIQLLDLCATLNEYEQCVVRAITGFSNIVADENATRLFSSVRV
ncbi:uncharacterized protein BYT42DRAFT_546021 [Radiomyces spectabilis]|uniref:uncharacterized protein n=1 Tax=Radiomyces spectabilis TaxID=64574 RepID=UPI002220A845|nr:uncharacterized protein BYT42DRAFT_546021 [Radiomyces spectabilis]KAI8379714.1 hypothetical protein BYT42DRAFT_546021 [Radiomyces spectabilis]